MNHSVKQGDTVLALAKKHGFPSADAILADGGNASLKESRKDPGILQPGDTVVIPTRAMLQEACAIDSTHKFKVTRPKAWVRVAVKDADGVALKGKKFQLTIEALQVNGTVPDDGIIEQKVPVDAKSGRLTVFLSDKPNDVEIWNLQLGWMDPLDSISGVQSRLTNLGFDCNDDGTPTGVLDEGTIAAIKAFQARIGTEETGAIDDTLKQKLTAYYDLAQDESTQDSKPS